MNRIKCCEPSNVSCRKEANNNVLAIKVIKVDCRIDNIHRR